MYPFWLFTFPYSRSVSTFWLEANIGKNDEKMATHTDRHNIPLFHFCFCMLSGFLVCVWHFHWTSSSFWFHLLKLLVTSQLSLSQSHFVFEPTHTKKKYIIYVYKYNMYTYIFLSLKSIFYIHLPMTCTHIYTQYTDTNNTAVSSAYFIEQFFVFHYHSLLAWDLLSTLFLSCLTCFLKDFTRPSVLFTVNIDIRSRGNH